MPEFLTLATEKEASYDEGELTTDVSGLVASALPPLLFE